MRRLGSKPVFFGLALAFSIAAALLAALFQPAAPPAVQAALGALTFGLGCLSGAVHARRRNCLRWVALLAAAALYAAALTWVELRWRLPSYANNPLMPLPLLAGHVVTYFVLARPAARP